MNKIKRLAIWLVGGVILAGVGGYVALEYASEANSYAVGFISCLVLGAILTLIFRSTNSAGQYAIRTNPLQKLAIVVLILATGLITGYTLFKINDITQQQQDVLKLEKLQQQALVDAAKSSENIVLISQLIATIDSELSGKATRTLDETTIDRISALSSIFEPYHYFTGDTLAARKLSPDRGKLLLMLIALNIDSSSMRKVFLQTAFDYADLGGADLSGRFLNNARLDDAHLRDANLQGTLLNNASLKRADLWGANLTNAECVGADMRRANLQWANLDDANCRGANFNSTDLRSAKLRRADLTGTELKWAFIQGAFLNSAKMTRTNLFDAHLNRAQLKDVRLDSSDMRRAIFIECDFSGAELSNSQLKGANLQRANLIGVTLNYVSVDDENWFELLETYMTPGLAAIKQAYVIREDTTNHEYILIPKASGDY